MGNHDCSLDSFREIRTGGLRILVREDLARAHLLKRLGDPDRLLEESDLLYKDSARTKAGRVCLDGRRFFLKRYNRRGGLHTIKGAFRPSRPWRLFHVTGHLIQRGVRTPAPAALMERRTMGLVQASYLLTDYVEGKRIRQAMMETGQTKGWRRRMLVGLADLVSSVHDAGVIHGDMKANNFLVQKPYGDCRLWVVDLDGARVKGELSPFQRADDLARLLTSLKEMSSAAEQKRFLMVYLKGSRLDQTDRKMRRVLAERVHALSHEHERRHLQKRGKKHGPASADPGQGPRGPERRPPS
jgi:tRNA A-37 threonylcarbamoyl transferase component Bud32